MRHRLLVLISLAILILLVIGWRLTRPPAIADAAGDVHGAMIAGNADVLYDHIYEHEKALGLDRQMVRSIVHELIQPRFARYRSAEGRKVEANKTLSQGYASALLSSDGGRTFEADVVVDQTDTGPRLRLFSLLWQAWLAEYIVEHGAIQDLGDGYQAGIDGLTKDIEFLRGLGVKGFAGLSREDGYRTLDDQLARLHRLRKEWQERNKQHSGSSNPTTHGPPYGQ